jgi:hypothetical protein
MLEFFKQFPELTAVMSEREDGSMKLFGAGGLSLGNRAKFFKKRNIDENKIISAEMLHGAKIEIVNSASAKIILGVDGLVARDDGIFLAVTVADCVPVYFYEPERKIIGIAHCGWRGVVGGIIKNSLGKIQELGGQVEKIKIALGPGINKCHFEIKKDVLKNFASYPEFVAKKEGKLFVDLKGIIKKQLGGAGVDLEKMENNMDCTMEHARYFSFRRDRPEVVESMIALIGMGKEK